MIDFKIDVIVRNEDAPELIELSKQLGYSIDVDHIVRTLHESKGFVFAARYDGKVIAFCSGRIVDNFFSRHFIEISSLIVDEKYRGQRIATTLLKHVDKWAEFKHIKKIRVRFNETRDIALFYTKHGFKFKKMQIVLDKEV